jgi:hypothetical protein
MNLDLATITNDNERTALRNLMSMIFCKEGPNAWVLDGMIANQRS